MILRLLMVVSTTIVLLVLTAFGPEGAPTQCWPHADAATGAGWVSALSHSSSFGALTVCTSRWTVVILGFLLLGFLTLFAFQMHTIGMLIVGWTSLILLGSAVGWDANTPGNWAIAAIAGSLCVLALSWSTLAFVTTRTLPHDAARVFPVFWEGFSWLFGALLIVSLVIRGDAVTGAESVPQAAQPRPGPGDSAPGAVPARPAARESAHRVAPVGFPPNGSAFGTASVMENTTAPLPSRPPTLLKQVRPRVPSAARQAGVSGEVRLTAEIDASGAVTAVEILSGLDTQVDAAATEAVRRWRFEPALRDGQAIAAMSHITIELRAGQPTGQLAAVAFTPVSAEPER